VKLKIGSLVLVFLLTLFAAAYALPVAAEFDETTRLAALAKVWGFLKYYHPVVAQGNIDWDEQLVFATKRAKSAGTRAEFNAALNELIRNAGDVNFLNYPRPVPEKSSNDPLFGWLKDQTHFMWYTVFKLELLIENFNVNSNRYCKYVYTQGNLDFSNENPYSSPSYPDEEHRLLALFRYWNIIHYFFPYKYLIGCDWEDVLDEFVPKIRDAKDAREYHLAIRELTARINDSHAATGSQVLSECWGLYYPPFEVRHVENQTIVTRIYTHLPASAGGLLVGDIILSADGTAAETLRKEKAKYVQASNEPTLQRNLNSLIFRGRTEKLHLTVRRDGQEIGIDVIRCYYENYKAPPDDAAVWSVLEGNIGYVNMGLLEVAQVDEMMAKLMGTKAIIFDIRNYPRSTLYKIGEYLNPEQKSFYMSTYADLSSPGHFLWKGPFFVGPSSSNPNYYKGKVAVLINETTQSQAEFTSMALQTAPRAVVIGSQTAGADGNVSSVWLPGGIYTYFSGIGIYYPDGRETQRIGIVPDIESKPTVNGIRIGRDEVLERALDYIDKGASPWNYVPKKERNR